MAESSARQSIADIGRLLSAAGVKPLAPSHAPMHAPAMSNSAPVIDTLLASTQRTLEATALDITKLYPFETRVTSSDKTIGGLLL